MGNTSPPSGLRYSDKTVYILGAGFSKPAGIPTMSQFMPEALAVLKTSEDPKDYECAENLGKLLNQYRMLAGCVDVDLNNLEELFCLADLPSSTSDNDTGVLKETIVRTMTLAYTQKRKKKQCPSVPSRYVRAQQSDKNHWTTTNSCDPKSGPFSRPRSRPVSAWSISNCHEPFRQSQSARTNCGRGYSGRGIWPFLTRPR